MGDRRDDEPIVFETAVPIVRIFDVPKAHEFYLGFLGFAVDWEHRYGDNSPLYTQISRSGLRLHLSEHEARPRGSGRKARGRGHRPVRQPHPLHGIEGRVV
jgi:hypothetical protein